MNIMNKIKVLLVCFSVLQIRLCLSQEKIFMPSEGEYVMLINISDWFTEDVNEYSGKYEFNYPGQTETGEYEGDAFGEELNISFDQVKLSATFNMIVEASWEQQDTLFNPAISGNILTANNGSGRFVTIKYKTLKGKIKTTNGVNIKRTDNSGYETFYQKAKKGSGGVSKINSIIFSGKELVFGISSGEFLSSFPEFVLKEPFEGFQIYSFSTGYDNAFENYWINAKFKNDNLMCFELNGWQTNEYMKILKDILTQLEFVKTVKEQDEDVGETITEYYKKDNLVAEYYAFETSVLKICLNR